MALKEGQTIDFDKGIIDAPPPAEAAAAEQTTATKTEEETPVDEVKSEVDKTEPTAAEKAKKQEAIETQASENTGEKEDKKEEKDSETEDEKEKDSDKKKDEPEEILDLDSLLAEKYAEDYQIKTEEDLDATLAAINDLEKENKELKAQLTEAQSAKPKFASEQEEKAFEFLKNFDVSRIGDGMQTLATVLTMDVKAAEPKILLEEQFILDNPELTRTEALRKFNRDYQRKYSVEQKDFEDEAAYKEALEDKRIDMKADAARAEKYLLAKQKELKAKPKESDTTAVKQTETIQKSITAHVSEVTDFMKEYNSVIIDSGDKNAKDFVYKLSPAQLKEVQNGLEGWIRNPSSYDDKGNLVGWGDVEKQVLKVTYMLCGEDLMANAYKAGLSAGEVKRAEEIATKKPDRVAKVASTADTVNEDQQWEDIRRKKIAERERRIHA